MYKVRYYMAGSNTRVCKIFNSLSEAIQFSNTKVGITDLFEIVKVD